MRNALRKGFRKVFYWLFTESCGMYLFVYEVSLRDRSYNRLRHRTFHGEAVLGGEMTFAKIPQLSVMNQKGGLYTKGRDEFRDILDDLV